ncbi:MAG: zinc-ribbon domain-containing protein, partial [Promethearchaeota archaeon]
MYCSNCGAELGVSNQKFCHNCGTEVVASVKATNYKTEPIQPEAAPKIQYAPVRPQYAPVRPQRQLQRGQAGKFSKLCLGLALASIVIGVISLVIGYNSMRFIMWPYYNVPA